MIEILNTEKVRREKYMLKRTHGNDKVKGKGIHEVIL